MGGRGEVNREQGGRNGLSAEGLRIVDGMLVPALRQILDTHAMMKAAYAELQRRGEQPPRRLAAPVAQGLRLEIDLERDEFIINGNFIPVSAVRESLARLGG